MTQRNSQSKKYVDCNYEEAIQCQFNTICSKNVQQNTVQEAFKVAEFSSSKELFCTKKQLNSTQQKEEVYKLGCLTLMQNAIEFKRNSRKGANGVSA